MQLGTSIDAADFDVGGLPGGCETSDARVKAGIVRLWAVRRLISYRPGAVIPWRRVVRERRAGTFCMQVGQRDLSGCAGNTDGADDKAHRAFLAGKDMLDARSDAGLLRIASAVRAGIGRPFGFFRWMWLTRPWRWSHPR